MMFISVLLLVVLFIAGLINFFFYFPNKRFSTWFQSLYRGKYSPISEDCSVPKRGLSDGKKEELKRVFSTFDKNGDGFITKQELRESMKNIGILLTTKDVEEMVERVDANSDGLIDPDEFCELYESMGGGGGGGGGVGGEGGDGEDGGENDMRDAFDVFDADKDGSISVEELMAVLSSLGLKEGKRLEDCKEMIKKVDMDGDGRVSFEEFKKMMKAGGKGLLSVSSSSTSS